MPPSPLVAIIILNWNGHEDTLACLGSLSQLDYPNCQVIVVDNASEDDSVAIIRASHPWATLLENRENLGFVGGNNVGLAHAQTLGAAYALLLNNDTEVAPDFLSQLVQITETDPQIGIAGPMIYYFDQPDTIWSAGGEIDWQRGLTHMLGMNEPDRGQFGGTPRPVDFVTGCTLLIKMHIVAEVGMLDPRFFAYYEETEWCVRVRRAGYQIFHVPEAKIWHKITVAAREASPSVHYYMTRNRLLFLKLSHAGVRAWVYTLIFNYARILLGWTFHRKWRHKAPQRRAMLQAIADYGRGRFGKAKL